MQQTIIITMRQRTKKFILTRIMLVTVLLFLAAAIAVLTLPTGSYNFILVILPLLLFVIFLYPIMIASYLKVRNAPSFSITIDAEGIHANKLFIAWNNIAAIYPVRVGIDQAEYVGVFPRDFNVMLRTSSLNPLLKMLYRWMAAVGRYRGLPPVGLRPDIMSTQELLQQLWHNYYQEYQRYHIATHPIP